MYIFQPKRKFYYPEFIYDTAFWGYWLVHSESYMNHTQTKNSLGQAYIDFELGIGKKHKFTLLTQVSNRKN